MKLSVSSLLVLAILIVSVLVSPLHAATPPQPTYGTANVDGNSSEWDLTNDFFANMYWAADSTKKIESKLYLRYECATHTLYVLVLAEPGVTIRTSSSDLDDSYVKINGYKLVDGNTGDNGIPPDIMFIGLSGSTAQGWEASFIQPEGSYLGGLDVHTLVNDGGTRVSAVKSSSIDLVIDCPETQLGCPSCETSDGGIVTVTVDQDVTVDFNPVSNGAPPTYTGEPDLQPYFTYDLDGPTADMWRAVFDLGAKKLLIKDNVLITVVDVPNTSNNRRSPGIEIRSTCELEIEGDKDNNGVPGRIIVDSENQPAGDILIQISGKIVINGAVRNAVGGTGGFPGSINISSCYGDIITGPKSRIETVGQDPGGSNITLLACIEGNIEINGLVDASYKGGVASTINIASFNGKVTIDGNNLLGIEAGTQRRITSGVTVRSTHDPVPGKINIQAKGDITVYGNTVLVWQYPNIGAVGIKTASNSAVGGIINVRSIGGKIVASDRAFDNANRFNTNAKINLQAKGNIELSATGRANSVHFPDGVTEYLMPVVSTQGGFTDGTGGTNTLRSFSGGIIIGVKAQVLANGKTAGANLLTSCTGVTNNGEVNPADTNTLDNSGVCTPEAPTSLFNSCADFGVGCPLCQPGIEIKKVLTSSDPTTVGSTVTFQIEVKNTGGTTLTDVDVSDTFDTAYLDFVSAIPVQTSVNEAGGTITWDNIEGNAPGGTFDPTETITITVTFTATATTPDPEKADNCASVSAKFQTTTVNDGPECDDVEINQAGIEIKKVLTSSDPTTVGSTVTFQIEVKNTGGTTLTDVDVSDTFDTAYLDFVSAIPVQTSVNEAGGTITWDNIEGNAPGGTFDPTETITITVTFTATATTPDPTKSNNCASVSAKFQTTTVNDGPKCDDVEINQAEIVIIKDAIPDDPQDFNFAVTGGPTTIFPFKLDDDGDATLPNTVTYEVNPGSYVVTETVPAGWTLTKIEIIQDPTGDSTIDLAGKKATLNVADGETVTVKFTNEKSLGEVIKYDFGDAPDPTYPTLLASNGARHIIKDIWMGATVDAESNGQPTISANGDDLNPGGGPDDEDGIIFLGSGPSGGPYIMPYTPGQNGAVQIKVAGSVTEKHPAYLHGWIDWNQDGDWNDLGENIFSGYKVTAPGDYTINFPVPANAKPGWTYARFRIDDQNLNSPTGEATNGEVEDYLIDPAVRPPEQPQQQQTPSRPVGGYVMPTNKLAILTPYLALAGLVGIASAIVAVRRRRKV